VLGFGGDVVRRGLAMADLEYDFMVHDYYSICPQITLTTERSRYCGESGLEACDACIGVRPSLGASDIRNWRMSNEWLVSGAKGVYAPSADAAARIERYFGVRPEVRYHESEISLQPVGMPRVSRHDARAPYRVVIIGALANHKGRQVVLDAAEAARKHGYPLQFHLIGDPLGAIPAELRAKLQWTGPYQEQDLARLIEESRADAFLFAATSPETYSYTLSSAIRTGLPIIATAIGAFPERLINHARAMLVPWDIDGGMLAKEIVRLLHELHRDNA
jgi:glycosyltransferase involved in cell wall biosynthesis